MHKSKNICGNEEHVAGHETELEMKPLTENLSKVKLMAKSRCSKFDFEDALKKTLVEVKGRKMRSDECDATHINVEKMQNADTSKTICFFFKFTDGVKCVQCDKEVFDAFKTKATCLKHRGCHVKNVCIPTATSVGVG
mmetsp:Transcript_22979/g.38473  ORF Transcript_22979/g.38473 Transcript_22979/m.38473 type:complete len:138 (-) Transcript_22979:269-682(-)